MGNLSLCLCESFYCFILGFVLEKDEGKYKIYFLNEKIFDLATKLNEYFSSPGLQKICQFEP